MNWRSIVRREIRQMFVTDRRRAVILFGASLACLILFGLLFGTQALNAVPIVIYDENQTQFSRSIVQAFDDSERFRIVDYVATQDAMEDALRNKVAYAAVHIPPKFAQDVKSGRSSTILLMADGANTLIINTVTTAAQEIVAAFSQKTGASLVQINTGQLPSAALHKTGPVDFRLRVLNNPTQGYMAFFVLGLAMAAFQQGIFLAVGASIQSEYPHPDDLKNARPLSIVTGKLLPFFVLAALAFFVAIMVAIYIFGIPGKASLTDLFLLSAAFIFAAIGFSFFIASLCRSELTFVRISVAYTVPAFIFSGYTWPQAAMDPLGKTLAYLFPLSYFSTTVRELMLAGYSPLLGRNSAILLLIGGTLVTAGAVCFIRRLES
jgi:ABC-type polysaccharide/polyol phosphate export systems, permease component